MSPWELCRGHGVRPKDVRPIVRLIFLIPIPIPKVGPSFPGSPCRVTLTHHPSELFKSLSRWPFPFIQVANQDSHQNVLRDEHR